MLTQPAGLAKTISELHKTFSVTSSGRQQDEDLALLVLFKNTISFSTHQRILEAEHLLDFTNPLIGQLYWVPQIAYDAWQGSRTDENFQKGPKQVDLQVSESFGWLWGRAFLVVLETQTYSFDLRKQCMASGEVKPTLSLIFFDLRLLPSMVLVRRSICERSDTEDKVKAFKRFAPHLNLLMDANVEMQSCRVPCISFVKIFLKMNPYYLQPPKHDFEALEKPWESSWVLPILEEHAETGLHHQHVGIEANGFGW